MGFFNIEKENKNKQNTFFNQNPNFMGNNQFDNSYNNQQMMNPGMQQPMMDSSMMNYNNSGMMQNGMNYNNPGMMQNDMNYNQFPNNSMMGQDYNTGMMNQGMQQPMMDSNMMNQGMMNQGMMQNDYNSNQAPIGFGQNVSIPDINQVELPNLVNQNMMNQNYTQEGTAQNYTQEMPTQSYTQEIPTQNYGGPNNDYHDSSTPSFGNMPMNNNFDQAVIKPNMNIGQESGEVEEKKEEDNFFDIDIPVLNRNQNTNNVEVKEQDNNLVTKDNSSATEETVSPKIDTKQFFASQPEMAVPPTAPEPEVENPPTVPENEKHEDIETLDEPQLPREIEKDMKLSSGAAPKEESKPEEKVPENLDPLENGSNPIPVNPIIAEIEKHQDVEEIGEQKDVKANMFAALGIIIGMIVKPGTTMINNSKKFRKMNKAVSIMLWLALLFLILCIGVRVGVGAFDRVYSSLTDSYKLTFNPSRIFELSNYLEFIIITVSLSIGGVMLVALIYYASSFLNSKGVHFATYLIVSNLGLIPLIAGSIVLYPLAVLFSGYLGIGVLIFAFLASLITILIGMNSVLKFKSVNNQIFYHVINLSVITLIAIIVFVFMIHNGWVVLPQMNI